MKKEEIGRHLCEVIDEVSRFEIDSDMPADVWGVFSVQMLVAGLSYAASVVDGDVDPQGPVDIMDACVSLAAEAAAVSTGGSFRKGVRAR